MQRSLTKHNELKSDELISTFLMRVRQTPDKPAVIYKNTTVTYDEFNKNVNQLAHELLSTYPDLFDPAKKPIRICVKCRDKLHALYCEFALLKLGVTFVPLSFDDPEARQNFAMEKSDSALILTDDHSIQSNTTLSYHNITNALGEKGLQSGLSNNEIELTIPPNHDDDAYVLFTSGSTANNPKGVRRTRSGLLKQMTRDYRADLNITETDCLLNIAPFTHDQAKVDSYAALLNGCTLCLYDSNNINVSELHHFMKEHGVSIFSSIPSMFYMIFDDVNKNDFPNLRIVTIGGEETKISHAELYQRNCPDHCVLINGYGATEISWVSSFSIDHQTDLEKLQSIPLGYATRSIKIKFMPVDDEDTGEANLYELCIASDSLSPGYLDDEAATNKAFFVLEGETYYRTGDLATIDSSNCIHFKGRKIWHEKINGKRIDLREVEQALNEVGFGSDCVVMAYGEGQKRKLYAFYSKELQPNVKYSYIVNLKIKLPAHEIPKIIYLSPLPTLPNGKIDRISLSSKLAHDIGTLENEFKILQNSDNLDQMIEGFWREALGIGMDIRLSYSTFQELGGTSALAIWLINKINTYLKDRYDFIDMLSHVDLYKNGGMTYSAFKWHVEELHNKTRQQKLGNCYYEAPTFKEVPATATVYKKDRLTVVSTTDYTAIEYNYSSLKLLADIFNKQFNINIRLGSTNQEILDIIEKFISDPASPSQIGLMLFLAGSKEAHPIPCVLCKNKENGAISLFISDSVPGAGHVQIISKEDRILYQIESKFPQIQMNIHIYGRQNDINSCSTDAILYLVEALQLDMLKETTVTKSMYNHKRNNFIDPSGIYKVSQVDLPNEISRDKSVTDFIAANTKDCKFDDDITRPCNVYLWEKGHEFRKIVESKFKKDILPDLYYFSIEHLNAAGDPIVSEMYIYQDYFLANIKITDDLLRHLYLYLNVPITSIKQFYINNQLLNLENLDNALPDLVVGQKISITLNKELLIDNKEVKTEQQPIQQTDELLLGKEKEEKEKEEEKEEEGKDQLPDLKIPNDSFLQEILQDETDDSTKEGTQPISSTLQLTESFNPQEALTPAAMFEFTTVKILSTLNTPNQSYSVIDIIDDLEEPPIARLFVDTQNQRAHLLYRPAHDGAMQNASVPSLQDIVTKVDAVRFSPEFKKVYGQFAIQEHFIIQKSDDYVAVSTIDRKLTAIHPKGFLRATHTDPDMKYIANVTGLPTANQPMHLGVQLPWDNIHSGHYAAAAIAINCENGFSSQRKEKMEAMTLENITPKSDRSITCSSTSWKVTKEKEGEQKQQIQESYLKLKKALHGFLQYYTLSIDERPQSLRGVKFSDLKSDWNKLIAIAKENETKTKDPLLKIAYKLILQISQQHPVIRLTNLQQEISRFEFLHKAYQFKSKHKVSASYNDDINLLYLNCSANKLQNQDILSSQYLDNAHEKRNIIHQLYIEIRRIKMDDKNLFSLNRRGDLKIIAYKQVIDALIYSAPDTTFDQILQRIKKQPVLMEGKSIKCLNDDYYEDEHGKRQSMKGKQITIDMALSSRRALFGHGLFNVTSREKWQALCKRKSRCTAPVPVSSHTKSK